MYEMLKIGTSARCLEHKMAPCFMSPSLLFHSSSEKKQEADQDEGAAALWIIGTDQQHARSSRPQVHASTRAHHAVCTQGHRA